MGPVNIMIECSYLLENFLFFILEFGKFVLIQTVELFDVSLILVFRFTIEIVYFSQ